jgi:N-acetylmuramoyl-L-alanine amidase
MRNAVPKFGVRKWCFLRKTTSEGMMLAGLLLIATSVSARSAAATLDLARQYFDKAKSQHAELEKIPIRSRTEKDYADLMEAYRRVYFTAPTYGNDTICLMAIAQLAEEAAPRFDNPQYLQRAIDSYEFLLKEYPHSQFRFEALLSIARIYDEHLNQPAKALEQYERYLKTFPGSAQSRGVKETMGLLRNKLANQPPLLADRAPTSAEQPPAVETAESSYPEPGSKTTQETSQKPAGPATVSDIRFWRTRDFTRVVLEMGQPVKYDVGRVESPDRLYVDLFDTRVTPASGKTVSVDDDMLRTIRVAQFNRSTSRVVLDLANQTEFAVSELTNPYRLVIDVRSTGLKAETLRADPTPPAKVIAENTSVKKEPPTPSQPEKVAPETGATGTKAATVAAVTSASQASPEIITPAQTAAENSQKPVEIADAAPASAPDKIKAADPIRGGAHSLTRALGLKIGRILIDPGHGGHDTGTIGPAGYMEKELVLDISKRLGQLIEERLGSEVIYTRDNDNFVSLEDRAKMANKQQADLFVSIHANSSKAKSAVGIETYYLSLTADPEALEVAARENAVSQETISELQGLVSKIALNEKVDESKEFAEKIQASLRKNLASGKARKFDRGVKKAPFVVLIGADMPAILAEISFLSNPEEEKRLKTEKHRQQIAEALYEGVANYADTLSGVKSSPTRAENPAPTQTASLE